MRCWLTSQECEQIAQRESRGYAWGQSWLVVGLVFSILELVILCTPLSVIMDRHFGAQVALAGTLLFGLIVSLMIITWRRGRPDGYRMWMDDLTRPDPDGVRFQTAPGRFLSLGHSRCIGVNPTRVVVIGPPFVFELEDRLDDGGSTWKLFARSLCWQKLDDPLRETSRFVMKDRSYAEGFTIPREYRAAVVDQLLSMSRDASHAKVFWGKGVLDAVKDELPRVHAERAERKSRRLATSWTAASDPVPEALGFRPASFGPRTHTERRPNTRHTTRERLNK